MIQQAEANMQFRSIGWLFLTVVMAMAITTPLLAQEPPPPPIPMVRPRVVPPPVPHPLIIRDGIVENVSMRRLPLAALQADADVSAVTTQESPGRGIHHLPSSIGRGIHLLDVRGSCNDFNSLDLWASTRGDADLWTDRYAGWVPFAVDGGLYRAYNALFSLERTVGPGIDYGLEQFSAKIYSNQPYAAGIGSPLIRATPGDRLLVEVDYLIWDHDTHGRDLDWASLGVKPDAFAIPATYVNGYRRGSWAELEQTVIVGDSGYIMVMLQAHSPVPLNSAIYFDNVRIAINGRYLASCLFE